MINIRRIILIFLLLIFIKKIFTKKKFIENFQKIGFNKINNSICQNFDFYKLNYFLTTDVECYKKCKDDFNCGGYYFKNDGTYDIYNGKPTNCFLVDKRKGNCETYSNDYYDHYQKKNFQNADEESLSNYLNGSIQLKDVSTLWSLILDPLTAGSEGYPYSNFELELYNKNNINFNLYKHLNDTWYYDSKKLCVAYGFDNKKYNIDSEECKWTIGIQGYWFKDIIDSKDTLEEAKETLISTEYGYAITYHPDVSLTGKYFIHSSSINLPEEDENYYKVKTYFYLPRNTTSYFSNESIITIDPIKIFTTYESPTLSPTSSPLPTLTPLPTLKPEPVKDFLQEFVNNQKNRYQIKFNIDNSVLFVGDFKWNSYTGRVGIYKFENGNWNFVKYINGEQENSYFGYSIDTGGGYQNNFSNYEVLAVGAYYQDVVDQFDHKGAVHIYTITYGNGPNMTWGDLPLKETITYGKPDDFFGISVSLNSAANVLCVGSSNASIYELKSQTCENKAYSESNWKNEYKCGGARIDDYNLTKECCFQKCVNTDNCKCITWMKNDQNKCRLNTNNAKLVNDNSYASYNVPLNLPKQKEQKDKIKHVATGLITIWKSANPSLGGWNSNNNRPTNVIYGNSNIDNDNFGYNVKVSGDGKLILVSSKGKLNIGVVTLYSYENDIVNTIPKIIYSGKKENDNFGCSIDMDNTGETIVIGAYQNMNARGYVNVYNKYQDNYTIVPSITFLGDDNKDKFGSNVSLNDNYLSISSESNIIKNGYINIYKSSNNYWNSVEIAKIEKNSFFFLYGTYSLFSKDKSKLAISYLANDQPNFDIFDIPVSADQQNAYIVPPNKANYGNCVLENKPCNNSINYCAGGNKYGNYKLQRKALLIATDDILNNKPYRNCPNLVNVPPDSNIVGIIVNPLELTINENSKGEINIVLTSKPSSDVRLIITTSILGEITLSSDLLIFNYLNWNSPQKLILNALNDFSINDEKYIDVNFGILSEDKNYNSLRDITVKVLKLNDDKSDLIITPANLEVKEGTTGKVDLKLNSRPKSDVIIKIKNKNSNEINLYNEKIIFTNEDWNSKKQVRFQGVIDNNIDGDKLAELEFEITSEDEDYKLPNKIVKINVLDDNVSLSTSFSHKCNLCECLQNDPGNCMCKSCIRNKYDKLYKDTPDISEGNIRKIYSNYLKRYKNLIKVGANTEMIHFILNINRFIIKNGNFNILIDKEKYINNIEVQGLIKNSIKNLFTIDFNKTSKVEVNPNLLSIMKNFKIFNNGNYIYQNKYYFNHSFINIPRKENISCLISKVYNKDENIWLLVFFLFLPFKILNL